MEPLEAMNRLDSLKHWFIKTQGLAILSLTPLAGDASLRRYYRLCTVAGSFIVMDAPPPQESVQAFVDVDQRLLAAHLPAPTIFAADLNQGFLLLTDFGDTTLLKALTVDSASRLYPEALQLLAKLQAVSSEALPLFDASWLSKEWLWHKEWFLQNWLGMKTIPVAVDAAYDQISAVMLSQPYVFMHRDYHSANLMVKADQSLGLLDFQDAFHGPLTYDLASLLRDCYIDWPYDQVMAWAKYYFDLLQATAQFNTLTWPQFKQWFDYTSLQRHLKALLTFARKAVRDHDDNYLKHIPRTLHYIISVSANYPELTSLQQFYANEVQRLIQQRLAP